MPQIPDHLSFLYHFTGKQILVTQSDKEHGAVWHHNIGDIKSITNRNRNQCGVFFTINDLNQKLDEGKKRTKRMLTHLRALYADDDKPRESYRTDWALAPSLIVRTSKSTEGYKFHYYWLLDQPLKCAHDDPNSGIYERMLHGLAEKYGTDSSSSQVNRVLRVPGFNHCKEYPQLIELIHTQYTGTTYSWDVLKQAFPPEEEVLYGDTDRAVGKGDWQKHLQTVWDMKGEEAWPHYSAAAMSLANDKCDIGVATTLIVGEVLQAFKDNGREIESWRVDNITTAIKSAYVKVDKEKKIVLETPISFIVEHKADPFPLELLPKIVREAVNEYARFIQVAPDALAASALSAMATVMGNKVTVVERAGLDHFPSLGFIIAAGSGERKSPVFAHMFQPVKDIEKELVQIWKKESATNAIKVGILTKKIKKAIAKLHEDSDEDEDEDEINHLAALQAKLSDILPKAKPQLYGMDITEETLGKVMSEQGGEFALLSAEARGIIDNITGKYSKGDKTGDSIILSAMTGDEIRNSRGGNSDAENRNSYIIENPCLNLCLFIQPDKAVELISHPKLADSGLLARTFILTPATKIGSRMLAKDDSGIDIKKTQGYYQAVHKVGLACSLSKRKIRMSLTAEAQEMHRVFNNTIEHRFTTDLAQSIHLFNKIVSMTVKVAAILIGLSQADELSSAIEYGNRAAIDSKILEGQPIIFEINAEVYGYAIRIIEYMIAMIKQSHEEMARDRLTILARDYLKWVSESKNKTKILKTLFKGKGGMLVNWSSERYKHDLERIYHELIAKNWAHENADGIMIRKDFEQYKLDF